MCVLHVSTSIGGLLWSADSRLSAFIVGDLFFSFVVICMMTRVWGLLLLLLRTGIRWQGMLLLVKMARELMLMGRNASSKSHSEASRHPPGHSNMSPLKDIENSTTRTRTIWRLVWRTLNSLLWRFFRVVKHHNSSGPTSAQDVKELKFEVSNNRNIFCSSELIRVLIFLLQGWA